MCCKELLYLYNLINTEYKRLHEIDYNWYIEGMIDAYGIMLKKFDETLRALEEKNPDLLDMWRQVHDEMWRQAHDEHLESGG